MTQAYEVTITASGYVTHADGTTDDVDAVGSVVMDEAQVRALVEGHQPDPIEGDSE